MDVQHAAGMCSNESSAKNPHEPGHDDEISLVVSDRLGQRGIEVGAVRVVRWIDVDGGDAGLLRTVECASTRAIAQHGAESQRWLIGCNIDEPLQIAARARSEHDHRAGAHGT